MDPFQDPGPSSQSPFDLDDHMSSTPGRKRVGFTSEVPNARPTSTQTPDEDTGSAGHNTPLQRSDVSHDDLQKMRESLRLALGEEYPHDPSVVAPPKEVQRPRPAIRKGARTPPEFYLNDQPNPFEDDDTGTPSLHAEVKERSGLAAQRRAAKLSKSVGTFSAPVSRRGSHELLASPPVELRNLDRTYETIGDTTDDDEEDPQFLKRASMLLRHHTVRAAGPAISNEDLYHVDPTLRSGQVTPDAIEIEDEHVSRPSKYRTGVLGTLLKASNAAQASAPGRPGHGRNLSAGTFSGASTAANSPNSSPPASGSTTPRGGRSWFNRHHYNQSATSISQLVGSSTHSFTTPAQKELGVELDEQYKKSRPSRPGMGKRSRSDESILPFKKPGKRRDNEIKIKIHLAGTLARQNYLRKLCRALMMYGAPTHRLEEYLNMSARVLEIEAQFLYMPGCMIIAFDDSSVHTSEVKLVRTSQGVDLGKLRDVHEIYKDVVHDRIGVEDATPRLEAIIGRKDKFRRWLRVFMYGLASATVGPFAFQARFIDLPFCFLLGCLIGWLQLIVAPGNDLISNVFEIAASIITSFAARALGSIRGHDGNEIFCFSAMAQSSIALILPGFMVLCASLELQSKHIVAGSVRMVYAIIYSLFLGFGITIGTVLYGMMDKNATSRTSCIEPMSTNFYYLFVPAFAICLMIVNQAKYKQMPSMTVIAFIGWVVNFHSSKYFKSNAQVSNTLGALAIGIAANAHARFGRHLENTSLDFWEHTLRPRLVKVRKMYRRNRHGPHHPVPKLERSEYDPAHNGSQPASRASSISEFVPHTRKIGYGLAAAAMLPAIFVQVPSGLSVQGSLVSGLTSADQIVRNSTGNATTISTADVGSSTTLNSIALDVGFSVVQIAIGITVGLFLAALIVYPLGKRRSGLFSF
ncbi:Nn.00g085120.m01.CDS01 [Neocucurbitaria sp. VM-36]